MDHRRLTSLSDAYNGLYSYYKVSWNSSFHLAWLFQIFSDEHCTQEVDVISVRNFEAMKWTIKTLNMANYIPGLTLGKK